MLDWLRYWLPWPLDSLADDRLLAVLIAIVAGFGGTFLIYGHRARRLGLPIWHAYTSQVQSQLKWWERTAQFVLLLTCFLTFFYGLLGGWEARP